MTTPESTTIDMEAVRRYHQARTAKQRAQREAERLEWLARVRTTILQLAPNYPEIERIGIFGSLVQAGRFRPDSDIDVAIACHDLEIESAFWRALEQIVHRDIDLRPWVEPIIGAVKAYGEIAYERKSDYSAQ